MKVCACTDELWAKGAGSHAGPRSKRTVPHSRADWSRPRNEANKQSCFQIADMRVDVKNEGSKHLRGSTVNSSISFRDCSQHGAAELRLFPAPSPRGDGLAEGWDGSIVHPASGATGNTHARATRRCHRKSEDWLLTGKAHVDPKKRVAKIRQDLVRHHS